MHRPNNVTDPKANQCHHKRPWQPFEKGPVPTGSPFKKVYRKTADENWKCEKRQQAQREGACDRHRKPTGEEPSNRHLQDSEIKAVRHPHALEFVVINSVNSHGSKSTQRWPSAAARDQHSS